MFKLIKLILKARSLSLVIRVISNTAMAINDCKLEVYMLLFTCTASKNILFFLE